MSSSRSMTTPSFIYLFWAGLGPIVALVLTLTLKVISDEKYLIWTLAPVPSVCGGIVLERFRRGSLAFADLGVLSGVVLGVPLLLLGYQEGNVGVYAFFVGPPGLAMSSYLIVAVLESWGKEVSYKDYGNVIVGCFGVLLPSAWFSNFAKGPRVDYAQIVLVILLVAILALWTSRYFASKRNL